MRTVLQQLLLAAAVLVSCTTCGDGEAPASARPALPPGAGAKIDALRNDVESALDSTVAALRDELRLAQETYGRDMAQKEATIEELRAQIGDRDTRLGPKMDAAEAQRATIEGQRRELKAVPASHWLSRLDSEDEDAQWFAIDSLARWHVDADGVLARLFRLALTENERFGSKVLDLLATYWRNPDMGPTLIQLIQTSEEADIVGAALEVCRRLGSRARSLVPELELLDFSDRHTPRVRKQLGRLLEALKAR